VTRETFTTRFGVLMAMIGVAVGLGNVWRFPYMVGRFGGAAFVLLYVVIVALIGVPALAAEWSLGRETRRGTVGALARGGLPFGRQIGWFFFIVVSAATAYYAAVIGWVLFHALGLSLNVVGGTLDPAAILPPDDGFAARPYLLQAAMTATVLAVCGVVMVRGLRAGIERASRVLTPLLFITLLLVAARSLTLDGAWEGVQWYLLKIDLDAIRPATAAAALGQAVFSLAIGGTFMVVYGSYLDDRENLRSNAVLTAGGDTVAGLLAGLAIFPAVFALGLEPTSGPGLLFSTLPQVFAEMPGGAVFGLLFFAGLAGVALLSAIAALEVLAAGLTDNLAVARAPAVWGVIALVFALSLPPTINMRMFTPWDLTFGSGMQTLGALTAVVTVGWTMKRGAAIKQLGSRPLYLWVRYVIPWAMIAVGVWWAVTTL